jgi:glycerol-3-phosphate dehydrogenase
MDMTDFHTVIPMASAVSVIGTAWLTIRKVAKDAARQKKEQSAEILHAAKEADAKLKVEFESQLEALKMELHNLEMNVEKDMDHLKETYNGEIRVLGEKIEELRSDLKNQHGQLVQLLTEMIKKHR